MVLLNGEPEMISYAPLFSGSAARNGSGVEERQGQVDTNINSGEQREIQRISRMQISKNTSAREKTAGGSTLYPKTNSSFDI